MYYQVQNLPRIHDISTDTANPPTFDAVLPLRRGPRIARLRAGQQAAEQRKGYPDIVPLQLPLAPSVAFDNAERAARAMGWQVVAAAPEQAAHRGDRHHAAVRLQGRHRRARHAAGQGSVVDVRSLSRVGGSDFGANAKRVRAYLQRVATASGTP